MMEIEDGRGSGEKLKIDNVGRAFTRAIIEEQQEYINVTNGKVWSVSWENITNAGANDYVFYMKNTGDNDIHLATIQLLSDTVTQAELHVVTGTAVNGSTITPISRNLGIAAVPSAILESSTDITGLASSGTLKYMGLEVVNKMYELEIGSNIIIPKGKAVALLIEATSCVTTGLATIFEE